MLNSEKKNEPHGRVVVYINMKTQDQTPSFPLICFDGDRVSGGGLVIYFTLKYWPLWFPFSQKMTLLKVFSPFEHIWVHQVKILWFTVDTVHLIALQDKLDTDGYLEVLMRSPPVGMDGKKWLGVEIPKTDTRYRAQLVAVRLALYPTSAEHCKIVSQAEIYDFLGGGINWIMVMIWQTFALKIVPMLMKTHAKFDGSEIDEHYKSGEGERAIPGTQESFHTIHQKIQKFLREKCNT